MPLTREDLLRVVNEVTLIGSHSTLDDFRLADMVEDRSAWRYGFVFVLDEAMHNDDVSGNIVDSVLKTRIEKGFSLTTVSAGKNKMPVACAIKWVTGYSMWKSNIKFTQWGSTDFIIRSFTLACSIKFVYADRSTV